MKRDIARQVTPNTRLRSELFDFEKQYPIKKYLVKTIVYTRKNQIRVFTLGKTHQLNVDNNIQFQKSNEIF